MYLLLSGEGPTDMGRCNLIIDCCEATDFIPGPMAIMVDQLVEEAQGYELSHIASGLVGFVHKTRLTAEAVKLKHNRKSFNAPGKKRKKETLYYRNNARAFAKLAIAKAAEIKDTVIAVLFRDADGTASSEHGHQYAKFNSMLDGFKEENFSHGIPMIPMPKSEAWLLCAVARDYQHCATLENESGNDQAPNSLKNQLSEVLNNDVSAQSLASKVKKREVDVSKIDMASFNQFKTRLDEVVKGVVGVGQ